VRSAYSQALPGWQQRFSYLTLGGLERQVTAFTHRPGRGIGYAYWPGYDSLCHDKGCVHPQSMAHLAAIDQTLGRIVRRLEGTDTTLLVLADHGVVDSQPSHRVDLAHVPGFYDCLATLPTGDARHVSCFVRPGKVGTFLDLVQRHLKQACACIPGEELLARGAYGPGRWHPTLENRIGDFALMAQPGYAFFSTVPGTKPCSYTGNHGGMSPEEVLVPLYTVQS
jgi:hypothetical protein